MNLRRTKLVMNDFAKYVIQQSRSNLSRDKKNVTKALYNSLDSQILQDQKGLELIFEMLEYGTYQDQGVSGTKKKYNTPFKYTNKYPNIGALDRWSVRKSQLKKKVRDSKGRFIPRKSLVFLIARNIFLKGIKPSLFFTKPFEKRFTNFINELGNGFKFDFENDLQDEKG